MYYYLVLTAFVNLLNSVSLESICLNETAFALGLGIENMLSKRETHSEREIKAIKTSLHITVMETWTTVRYFSVCSAYFAPHELESCEWQEEKVFQNDANIAEMKARKACKVGKICDGQCKGEAGVALCDNPRLFRFSTSSSKKPENYKRAHFLVRQSCEMVWSCEHQIFSPEFSWVSEDLIEIVDLQLNRVVLNLKKGIGFHFGVSYAFETYEVERAIVLSCLNSTAGTLCHDIDGEHVFVLQGGETFSEGSRYVIQEHVESKPVHLPDFLGSTATMTDLHKVYRHLEYTNVQTIYNVEVLAKIIRRTNELTKSILMFLMKFEDHPLSDFFHREVKTSFVEGQVIVKPCYGKDTLAKRDVAALGPLTNTTVFPLFLSLNLSLSEFGDMNFTLNWSQRKYILDSIQKLTDTVVIGNEAENSQYSFFQDLWNFWLKIEHSVVFFGAFLGFLSFWKIFFSRNL
jgi:hypothetical protein